MPAECDADSNRDASEPVPGDINLPASFSALFQGVYKQLRAMAQEQMGNERSSHTLHATELVHQAYLRLYGRSQINFANEGQFVRAAAEAMRRILIEHARKRGRLKRGGDRQRVEMTFADHGAEPGPLPEDSEQLVALDNALELLNEKDPRAADVIRMRFFAGLSVEQTAQVLGLSERTIKREWEFARAWLRRRLQ